MYFWLNIILQFFLWGQVLSKRHDVHEMMYTKLSHNAACFRRLNGTHQFGCSSERGGNVGIIHIIKSEEDLTLFLNNAIDDTYMVVLYMNMFTSDVIQKLIKEKTIGGLLVAVEKNHIPNEYSPDDVCPNSLLSPCSEGPFNPIGNKFLLMDWPFPMFMVDDEDTIVRINMGLKKIIIPSAICLYPSEREGTIIFTHKVQPSEKSIAGNNDQFSLRDAYKILSPDGMKKGKCYNSFNVPFGDSQLSRPLCSLQMKSHMSAAVDSPTCIRRTSHAGVNIVKYCDPMGDQNIILPMEFKEEVLQKSVVVIAARLDAASLFDRIAPGAITSVTGIVTLLTTAQILSTILKNLENDGKRVMFMLLNGEVHDYIGSSRIVYDMEKGDFASLTSLNMSLDNIMTFIEISQVDSNSTIFLHNTKAKKIYDFESELKRVGESYSLQVSMSSRQDLPPSSLHVFAKADPALHGIVIANFDKEFSNKYFNGLLDNAQSIKYDYYLVSDLERKIVKLSKTIASTVYTAVTGSSKNIDSLDYTIMDTVHELLYCYLESRLCRLMKEVYSGNEEFYGNNGPFPLYVGVQPSANPITTTTGLLLAYLTSDQIPLKKENCSVGPNQKAYSFFWVHGPNKTGVCLNTTLKFTPAVSPAFLIPDYDWKSGNYSTWTESIWLDISLGMFLKPSRKQELITFSTGLAISLVSFFSVFWFNKKSGSLFFKPYLLCGGCRPLLYFCLF